MFQEVDTQGSKPGFTPPGGPLHCSPCGRHSLPVAWAWKRKERAGGRDKSLPAKSLPELSRSSVTL